MNKCWPCEVNDIRRLKDIFAYGRLLSFPQCGYGDRYLDCNQYDRCLDMAITKSWYSFHCESCIYDQRGKTNFVWERDGSIREEEADQNGEEWFEVDPADLQGIDYGRLDLESVLLAIIEERGLDE